MNRFPPNLGCWCFSPCSTDTWYPKCWNAKEKSFVMSSLLYSIMEVYSTWYQRYGLPLPVTLCRGVTRPLAKGGQGNEDFSLACERSERGSRGLHPRRGSREQSPLAGSRGQSPRRGSRGRSPRKLTGFSFIFTPRSWLVVHIIWNLITTTITTIQAMILMILSFINNYHFKCKTNEKL